MRFVLIFLTSSIALSPANLSEVLAPLESKYKAKIGVAALKFGSQDFLFHRETEFFKMSSTVKLPIAVTLLHKSSIGEINLDELVEVRPDHLLPGSGKLQYFAGHPGLSISLRNLLEPMLIISESTASDVVLEKLGGADAVSEFLETSGITNIHINRTFAEIFMDARGYSEIPPQRERSLNWWNSEWAKLSKSREFRLAQSDAYHGDDRDTTTPKAMLSLLLALREHSILPKNEFGYLFQIMQNCETGDHRIRKGLPRSYVVSNKTGTWNNLQYEYMGDVGYFKVGDDTILFAVFVETKLPSDWKKGLYSEPIFPEVARYLKQYYFPVVEKKP